MYDFYWYPKCSTCRKAKAKLDELGIDYQAIDLKETPPSQQKFEKWFKEADFPIKKFFNTSGRTSFIKWNAYQTPITRKK